MLLWKADENNFATISLALSIYDRECKEMEECLYEIKTQCQNRDQGNHNEGAQLDLNQNVDLQPEFIKQKIKIYVDKPKDEKLCRIAHHRAGSGSTFLCTYCPVTRAKAAEPPFSGCQPITITNRLEYEAGTYVTQNPAKMRQSQILGISLGQKGIPLTTSEPCQEPPDVLHEDINIVHPLFVIGSRILHFGEDTYPQYTYTKRNICNSRTIF